MKPVSYFLEWFAHRRSESLKKTAGCSNGRSAAGTRCAKVEMRALFLEGVFIGNHVIVGIFGD
ncbi:MAG: hypothetical protein PVH30_07250, partial [Desulfobacterales bacterium]